DPHLVTRADDWDPLAVLEKLHPAHRAVVFQQHQRKDEVERNPRGSESLDQARLIFLHEREDENRADRRQPRDERKYVVVHVVCSYMIAANTPRSAITMSRAKNAATASINPT